MSVKLIILENQGPPLPPFNRAKKQAKITDTEDVTGNADLVLTKVRTFVYALVDITGGTRQIIAAAAAGTSLWASKTVSIIATATAGAGIALGLILTGIACTLTGLFWTIPDANKGLQDAKWQSDKAINMAEIAAKKNKTRQENLGKVGKAHSPKTWEVRELAAQRAAHAAQRALLIERFGLTNQFLYYQMGVVQAASGVVAACSAPVAHVFHYATVLTGAAAGLAAFVAGIALGVVYLGRGIIMGTRAAISYRLISEFHNEFSQQFRPGGTDDAMQYMKEMENSFGEAYLNRRVDASCLSGIDLDGTTKLKYTAQGIKRADGNVKQYVSESDRNEYLKRVDKGIYTAKFKQKVSMIIAAAMFLGGATAIVLTVLTGGTAPIIVALVSAIFFIAMEWIFLSYDSAGFLDWLRDRFYNEPTRVLSPEIKLAFENGPLLR
jgi:hypothetical protein